MTWFRIDDGFATHPKVDALGEDQALAVAAWTLCGVACARDLTDGLVTAAALRRTLAGWSKRDRDRAVSALVSVGLWVAEPSGGWRFHDWQDHQPLRSEILSERERKAKNQRDSRQKRASVTGDKATTSPVTAAPVTGDGPVSHHGPTRPDPTRPSLPPEETHRARARGLGIEPRSGARPPPTLAHLLAEHRRVLGRAWVSERELVEAWDGGGLRSVAKDVEVAKRILAELETPEAITSALEGWARSDYGRAAGFRMAAFAREPGSHAASARQPASAPSSFAHCYDANGDPVVPDWLREDAPESVVIAALAGHPAPAPKGTP